MRFIKLLIAVSIIFYLGGCSTISSSKQAANLSSITANKTYQLRVRSGNIAIDKLIYKTASAEFGKYLRMQGQEPFNAEIDVVFSSQSGKGFSGAANSYVNNVFYGNSWYTGSETFGYQSMDREIATGGPFTWQNSAMTVTIREREGKVLWDCQYNYKGSLELSRLYVSSADDAAKVSLLKIIKLFEKEFIMARPVDDRNYKNPGIALIVEKKNSPESREDQVTEESGIDKK